MRRAREALWAALILSGCNSDPESGSVTTGGNAGTDGGTSLGGGLATSTATGGEDGPGGAPTEAVLSAPTDGTTTVGAIPVEGWVSSPAGTDKLVLRVSWSGEPGRDLVLCSANCYGQPYTFHSTLGPEGLGAPPGDLTLALYLTQEKTLDGPYSQVTVTWSPRPISCLPGAPGPVMVEVPVPPGGSMCIDSTEVTRGAYNAFLSETNDGANLPGEAIGPSCANNDSYVPDAQCLEGDDRLPVACVDWCDAYAYCKWAGKRLCGSIFGGSNSFQNYLLPHVDQWMNACTSGDELSYFPYGDEYSSAICNVFENRETGCFKGQCTPVPAGAMALCQPPGDYQGVFDLSGNLREWEDSTSGSGGDVLQCRLRGGGYVGGGGLAGDSCGADDQAPCDWKDPTIGFRCCGP